MEFKIIRKTKDNESIYCKKLKVAAYVRVSSKLEIQEYSYESQIKYYNEVIKKNANWEFVDLYCDYGISGTIRKKRKEFLRMIEDCKSGKIDLILTKSISRFARNTYDALDVIRDLKRRNIAIYFEEEHLNTLKLDSEILLSILCAVSQQESENLSNHIKLGHEMLMKQGKTFRSYPIYGYDVIEENGEYTYKINKKEAKIVQYIFNQYIEGKNFYQIAKILNEKKIKSRFKYGDWTKENIRNLLLNPKYAGKVITRDYVWIMKDGVKVRTKNNGIEDQYVISNHHEAIISEEIFDKVQDLINTNKSTLPDNTSYYKIPVYCGFCGRKFSYTRRTDFTNQYTCNGTFDKRNTCTKAKKINDEVTENAFYLCIKKLVREKERDFLLSNYNRTEIEIKKINNRIDRLVSLNTSNIDKYIKKEINLDIFNKTKEDLENEINSLNSTIQELEANKLVDKEIKSILEDIFLIIDNNLTTLKEFDKELYESLISFVIIGGNSEKGTKLPYLIRFIYSIREHDKLDYKEIVLNNPLEKNKFIKILDFKSNFKIRYKDKNGITKYKNGTRITFEIER